jgi:hypothetical protein
MEIKMYKRLRNASLVALVFLTVVFAQPAKTVAISGTVIDESGAPLAGAKVHYNNSPKVVIDKSGHTKVTGTNVNSTAVAGGDGKFSINAVPAGVYWLCAEGTQASHLRSCDWGFDASKVDLTAVSSASNIKLQVHDGITITFQVNDARNQVKDFATAVGAAAPPGNFRIFVVDGPRLKPAQLVSSSGGTRNYAVTVPKVRTVRLLVDTKLSVVNSSHATLASASAGDTIAVNGQPVTYSLTVQ